MGYPTPDQRSLTDQLRTLAAIGDREGLYDAADFIRDRLVEDAKVVETEDRGD